MTHRPRWRDRLLHHASALLAVVLFAASMLVASTFRTSPGGDGPRASGPDGSSGPGPGAPAASLVTTAYGGPDLIGIFTGCNPACDLEVAREGVGRRLTFSDRAIDESAPVLSPDGTRVAYRCAEPAVEPGGEATPRPAGLGSICLVDIIGNEQDATPPPTITLVSSPDVDYGAPAWAPDGSVLVADARSADGSLRLVLVDPATGTLSPLEADGADVSGAAWSADGSTLAVQCGEQQMPSGTRIERFCSMPSEGGMVTQLGGVEGDCGLPAFMPDGVHLGVVCIAPGAQGADLFMLSLDESFTHRYTASEIIAPEGVRRVVFDPDQRYAYVRRGDELWAIGIPGGEWSLPPLPPLHGDFDLRVLAE